MFLPFHHCILTHIGMAGPVQYNSLYIWRSMLNPYVLASAWRSISHIRSMCCGLLDQFADKILVKLLYLLKSGTLPCQRSNGTGCSSQHSNWTMLLKHELRRVMVDASGKINLVDCKEAAKPRYRLGVARDLCIEFWLEKLNISTGAIRNAYSNNRSGVEAPIKVGCS